MYMDSDTFLGYFSACVNYTVAQITQWLQAIVDYVYCEVEAIFVVVRARKFGQTLIPEMKYSQL